MSTYMNSHLTCKYIQNNTQNYPNVHFYELPPHMLIHSERLENQISIWCRFSINK